MQDSKKNDRNIARYRALWIAKRFWQIEHDIIKPQNVYRSSYRNSQPTGQGVVGRVPITLYKCPTCKTEYREVINLLCFTCYKKGKKCKLEKKTVNRIALDPERYPKIAKIDGIEILAYQINIPNETRQDEEGNILFEMSDNESFDLYPENYMHMMEQMLIDGVSPLMKVYEDLVQPVSLYQWDKERDSYRTSRTAERKNLIPLAKWFVDNFDELRVKVVSKKGMEF